MRLAHLLAALPGATTQGDGEVEIRDIAYDSRAVEPGTLFVAVPTVGGDPDGGGARFIPQAIRQGAVAVVTQVAGLRADVPTIYVANAREALAGIAATFYGHPSKHMQVYAVTGTDGKTTTTYWLEQIFSAAGYRGGLIGTVEIKIGEQRERNQDRMTTPESLDVQRLLRRMLDAGVTHVAMEASSHALALDRLRCCHFRGTAITNITVDHIEFHGSREAYVAAKEKLFVELAPDAPSILNRDDQSFEHLRQVVPGAMITYGFSPEADVRATDVTFTATDSRCLVQTGGEETSLRVPLPGAYNVSNALAALSLARLAGVSISSGAQALATATPPPGRMQTVDAGQPFRVVVDYAHTINAFRSVLAALRQNTEGRLIAVFGAAGNRDRAKRPVLAGIAREMTDFFVITNEDPFDERAEDIMAQIASGVPIDEAGCRYVSEPDRGRAIQIALHRAQAGDTVVILGKGHEQSIMVHGHKESWNDVAAVREALGAPG